MRHPNPFASPNRAANPSTSVIIPLQSWKTWAASGPMHSPTTPISATRTLLTSRLSGRLNRNSPNRRARLAVHQIGERGAEGQQRQQQFEPGAGHVHEQRVVVHADDIADQGRAETS